MTCPGCGSLPSRRLCHRRFQEVVFGTAALNGTRGGSEHSVLTHFRWVGAVTTTPGGSLDGNQESHRRPTGEALSPPRAADGLVRMGGCRASAHCRRFGADGSGTGSPHLALRMLSGARRGRRCPRSRRYGASGFEERDLSGDARHRRQLMAPRSATRALARERRPGACGAVCGAAHRSRGSR